MVSCYSNRHSTTGVVERGKGLELNKLSKTICDLDRVIENGKEKVKDIVEKIGEVINKEEN